MSYLVGSGVNMATIWLYNNSSENNAIPKTINLVAKYEGVDIKQGTSLTTPTILLSGALDPSAFNYCLIDVFNRYYFIKDIIMVGADLWEIQCTIDVLETYKSEILSRQYLVERQEYKVNNMLVDDQIVSRVGTETTKKVVGNVGNEVTYVITVTGGAD